ncbi:substrate-binding domain-containing protein [Actinomycetes bacterium M1A6_2h]
MGEHRRESDNGGGRGVSKGPIIVVVALVAVVALVVGWFQLRDRISDQGVEAAQACVEGSMTVEVSADPDIADRITELARRWNDTAPVVRDHCITLNVTAAPSAAMASELQNTSSATDTRPALWIPSSSVQAAPVLETTGAVNGTPKSVASSPAVLAGPAELTTALGAAAVGWADLPRLAGVAGSLDSIGLPGWGALRLALPTGAGSDATALATEAVAMGLAGVVDQPLTADQVTAAPVVAGLSQLALADTDEPPADTAATLAQIVSETDAARGTFHTVPATEQQLYAARKAGSTLTVYRPAGATPIADHPAVVLAGVDETQSSAAAEFVDYVLAPEQQNVLGQAGFRVAGPDGRPVAPANSDGLEFAAVGQPAPTPTAGASAAIASTLANPVTPTTTTILLDISGSMETVDGSASRLTNTTRALSAGIEGRPDSADVGLWVYSRSLDGSSAYRIEEPTGPLGADGRRSALTSDLAALRPATATSTYVSVQAAYRAAVDNWDAGRSNSLLLVTDGPNDDSSLTAATFLTNVRPDPARPVRIDVVSLATNSDLATLRTLAGQTGGELVETSSSDPSFTATIDRLLAKKG